MVLANIIWQIPDIVVCRVVATTRADPFISLLHDFVAHDFLHSNRDPFTALCQASFSGGWICFPTRLAFRPFRRDINQASIGRLSFATAGIDWPFSRCGHSVNGNEPEKSFLTVSSREWETTRVVTRLNGTTNPGNRPEI